jgi:glutamyl-tRNA reductase
MRVGVLGINYKSSELILREMLARASVHLFGRESKHAAELSLVLLSTCNRTEVYFSGEDLAEIHSRLLHLLREEVTIPFEHKLYSYFGGECFAHLSRVTAGLDSAIVAETEIQSQVKMAYTHALCDHPLKSDMHFLFQKCLKVGKTIRSAHVLPKGGVTLEKLVHDLCERMVAPHFSVFFVGNSEINRKVMAFLQLKGIKEISLCTRSVHSAKEMHALQNVKLVDWHERQHWQLSDIVICGSNYSDYVITSSQIGTHCRSRAIFDLSMPRNVDPRLSRHPELRLFNIEELGNMISEKHFVHAQAICHAEALLRKEMEAQVRLFHHKQNKRAHRLLDLLHN